MVAPAALGTRQRLLCFFAVAGFSCYPPLRIFQQVFERSSSAAADLETHLSFFAMQADGPARCPPSAAPALHKFSSAHASSDSDSSDWCSDYAPEPLDKPRAAASRSSIPRPSRARDKNKNDDHRKDKEEGDVRAVSDAGDVRKNANGHVLCRHNVRLYRCGICGGAGICEHSRHRYYCVPCGGGGICEHQRRRYRCCECKRGAQSEDTRGVQSEDTDISRRVAASIILSLSGGAQPVHSPADSMESSGGEQHAQSPELRRDKTSHILCPHNVRLYRCVPCGGTGICEHYRRRCEAFTSH